MYVPTSPPLWTMILRNESTSLKLCGVLTVVQLESSKAGASAPPTSCRMNFQSKLKFSFSRGDAGGTYPVPAANTGYPDRNTTGSPTAATAAVPRNLRRVSSFDIGKLP